MDSQQRGLEQPTVSGSQHHPSPKSLPSADPAAPRPSSEGPRPLEGVRVLDLGTLIGAPFGATLLGEFGAEVIKVEMPGGGDPLRTSGPSYRGLSLWWASEGRNKKSITLDLRRPEGQRILKELVARSDVVFENFRPGTLEGWGLGYEDLRQVNPALVMVRVSGYGQTGPYRHKPGYDRVGMAFAGLTYVTGYPDAPPVRPGPAVCDYLSAVLGALGAMIALYYRDARRTGQGQYVDLGLYESIWRIMEFTLPAYDKLGTVRERIGNMHPLSTPGENFQTKDGRWLTIACVGDRVFARFARLIGREDWLSDPRFATDQARAQHKAAVHAVTAEWVAQRTLKEALEALDQGAVPAGPVYNIADVVQDPHIWARENIVEVQDPTMGPLKIPGVVPKLSLTPGAVASPAPALGQHNEEIYHGLLGYSQEDLARLKERGII